MQKILPKPSWIIFTIIAIFLGWYVVFVAKVQLAGDIAEYYGVTESLANHGSVELSYEDRGDLEKVLHKAYFEMPGYYVEGRGGARYPVHFWFYSILSLPIRLLMSLSEIDARRSLLVVNWLSVVAAVGFIFKRYINEEVKRVTIMVMVFTGAMMSFLVWPGPDMWYLSLLLIVPFAYFEGDYWLAAVFAALASWHSQPVIIMAAGLTGYAVFRAWLNKQSDKKVLKPNWSSLFWAGLIGCFTLFPYAYNYYAFDTLTLWTKLQDGWTIMRGFGAHNMSLWKFYEQWFDLNIGLFWYAPAVFILGIVGIWKNRPKKISLWFFVFITLVTAFFYQTNPAWHYGTVGFGPGRHGVYLLPIIIYFATQLINSKLKGVVLIVVIGASQVWGLSLNGFLEPDFTKTLHLSPHAESILAHNPNYYNPTPEIFVDRVNHSDLDYPTSAIYKVGGKCVKAYVLITDKERLESECGQIPDKYLDGFDNAFLRHANYKRTIVTKEATFWPYPDACADWFVKSIQQPFECMRSIEGFMELTGLTVANRIVKVQGEGSQGVWKLSWGDPVKLTIPEGYIINHYSIDGLYVNF